MLASLTGLSGYIYAALAIGGVAIVAVIIWLVWFRSKQDFARGADAQKVETAEERVDRAEAETDLARRQGSIMAERRDAEDAAKRLDKGDF